VKKHIGWFLGVALVLAGAAASQACVTDADCTDNNACNGAEYCQAGICFNRSPLVCDDGNPCTIDGCDPQNGCTVTPAGGCMLGGQRLKLGSRSTLHFLAQSDGKTTIGGAFPVRNSLDDPVFNGASIRIFSTSPNAFDVTFGLPSSNWMYVGHDEKYGYLYKDLKGALGPIRQLVVRNGKPTKIKGQGAQFMFNLITDPYPVNVEVHYGQTLYDCMSFGGTRKYVANVYFLAQKAPAPNNCPF
jgi:hypothetical protein